MRRGSALLIVLGMLAFIVASAVGFAAYMRYSRLPSSYLRRTSASRLLAKAALAEAIDIIDNSIGNSAYPGKTGKNQIRDYRRITDDEDNPADVIDYWQDRCFIGSNALVSVESTVSTLCTEALAYIPPPIINEVRYYSRRSLAAQWHTLGFDAGRFAFSAVDVSDFFDVNSVRCNPSDIDGNVIYGRNSSDSGRVTLAHLFENTGHTGYSTDCTPDKWDEFMDDFIGAGKVPLVSVADMNLAVKKAGFPVSRMAPFCNYLDGNLLVPSDTGEDADFLRGFAVITDSLLVMTNRSASAVNIANRNDQPFVGNEQGATLKAVVNDIDNKFLKAAPLRNSPFYNQCEIVQLYDYLDEDSVPISLCLPTVERTPMITGVSLNGNLKVEVTAKKDAYTKPIDENTRYVIDTYTLKLSGGLEVNFGKAFPFKYDRGTSGSYESEAFVTVALMPKCKPESEGLLRCNNAKAPGVVTLENGVWKGGDSWETAEYVSGKPSVARHRAAGDKISPKVVTTEEDVILDNEDKRIDLGALNVTFEGALPANDVYNDDTCTFRTCRKQIKQESPGGGAPTWADTPFDDPTPIADRLGWLPVEKDLSAAIAADKVQGQEFVPVVQVWVRLHKDNETVDLVPACWKDDKTPCDILADEAAATQSYPMLRFRSANDTATVKLEDKELTAGGEISDADIFPQAYVTDDPRFNFAPENFDALSTVGNSISSEWLSRARQSAGGNGRDGDVFMTTSDAGYLQSAYELTHLVRVCPDGEGFGALAVGDYGGNAGTMPSRDAMWSTYSQFDVNGLSRRDIDRLDIVNGFRGFRVNPYAQSPEILETALANPPLDWWAAATNETANTKVHQSASSAQKYSFSELSGAQVPLRHDDIGAFADVLMGAMRKPDENRDWRTVFDGLGWWNGDPSIMLGQQLAGGVKLHSVDRKFLHGFWKECFANRQQLFLVFVRAEPMMMGGGGMGQTPPQLGARAVALVWRDPAATSDDVSGLNTSGGPRPHRTRVLFYRQFD